MSQHGGRDELVGQAGTVRPRTAGRPNGDVIEYSEDGVHYASHDMTSDGLCTTIALALSEVADVEVTALVSNFAAYADPDALNRLFRTHSGRDLAPGGTVQIHVQGYRVRVDADGRIAITDDTDTTRP